MKKLIRVEVKKLLNEFNHEFDFPAGDEFVILHGPNGVGKTRLLELIQSAVSGRTPPSRTPFHELSLYFDDSTWLRLLQADAKTHWSTSSDSEMPERLLRQDDEKIFSLAARDLMEQGLIRRSMSAMQPGRPYRDSESGEWLSAQEAVERYSSAVDPDRAPVPAFIRDFAMEMSASLVAVNRLRIHEESLSTFSGRTERVLVQTVDRYANLLSQRITKARADHAIQAQLLDGSYPRRLLSGGASQGNLLLVAHHR